MSPKDKGGKSRGKKSTAKKGAAKKSTSKKSTAKKGATRKDSPPVSLPSSGLAAEILASLEESAAAGEPLDDPDRVYRFADEIGRQTEREEEPEEPMETWVSFRLRGETFGFPVHHVREVIRVETLTRVPHAPFPVRGITTLRGQILPVVDLRRRLGLGETEPGSESRILVVSSRQRTLGLLVEGVEQVVRIAPSRVEPAPEDVLTDQSDYILGVYDLDPGLMILLDLDTVMRVRDPERIEGRDDPDGRGKP